MGEIRVGISGWTYAGWRGDFYPRGLPQKKELAYAAERMGSVEINGSFYSLQRPTSYASWREQTPDDFVFAVKGGRFVTHMKRLRDVDAPLANFFASGLLALGPKLGPILWQIPERLQFDADLVGSFFAQLPRTMGELAEHARRHDAKVPDERALTTVADGLERQRVRHALEFRSPSFCTDEAFALMREHDVACVVADTAGRFPMAEAVTSDLVYVRLHGDQELYTSGYGDALFLATFSFAQEKKDTTSGPQPTAQVFESKQSVTIDGKTINLNAKAGTMELRDENNKPIALFGFTAYFKENPEKDRPIVFAYNGGPGSSSYWLHMGIMGPKRIVVDDPNYNQASPYELVNNEFSILDVADVVMMDPIGTGLSVPIGEAKGADFWGVDQDIRSVSLFIMQFLKTHNRLNSPKYILGESYGTFRNAGVMSYLLDRGYALNGVIMVSAVLDLRTLFFAPNEDLPYIVYLPTMAATSWYHDKVANKGTDLPSFVQEVRDFTDNHYTPALFKGNKISEAEENAVAQKLQDYTGISSAVWKRADLKITASEYFQELLRTTGETVGRLDSRYKGINVDPMSMDAFTDPQSDAISSAYTMGFLDYFHGSLGVSKDLLYATSAYSKEGFRWDWKHQGNNFWGADAAVTTVPDMTDALSKDPNVKVLIMNGYYDLATVFYGVEHSISHIDLPKSATDRIIMTYYEAGHMMYTHLPSAKLFREDLKKFIADTLRK